MTQSPEELVAFNRDQLATMVAILIQDFLHRDKAEMKEVKQKLVKQMTDSDPASLESSLAMCTYIGFMTVVLASSQFILSNEELRKKIAEAN